jgi:CheY-like chemotaxis protein
VQPEEINKGKPAWKILVVDDDTDVTKIMKLLLEQEGHTVQTANSGKEALALLEDARFDLVTTDFSMAGMKGSTLAARIKEGLPKQPVLMISTNGALAKAAGDPLPGVDMVMSKPFYIEDLRKAIARLLPVV